MKIGLILTNDWELRGDGSGDFFSLQAVRLKEIIDFCDNSGMKMTVFAEIGQQYHHKRLSNIFQRLKDIAYAWEELIKECVQHNHDVQLHFHAQWIDADYKREKWFLNGNKNINLNDLRQVEIILTWAKSYLESLIIPIKKFYSCYAFRSGGYIQPSPPVLRLLKNLKFHLDSSVISGLFDLKYFDYSDVPSDCLPWKFEDNNAINQCDGTFWEFPISSHYGFDSFLLRQIMPIKLFYFLKYKILVSTESIKWLKKNQKLLKDYPLLKRPFTSEYLSSFNKLSSLIICKKPIKLDYDVLPPEIFVEFIKNKYLKSRINSNHLDSIPFIPIIAIGHTKQMSSIKNLQKIDKLLKSSKNLSFEYMTLTEGLEELLKAYNSTIIY